MVYVWKKRSENNKVEILQVDMLKWSNKKLLSRLTNAIDGGEYVFGIFIYFSKAFDIVDHDILLGKLYHYGIRGCAHNWLASYLSNRKEFVACNGVQSDTQTIKYGVPESFNFGSTAISCVHKWFTACGIIYFLCCVQIVPTYCCKNINHLVQTINWIRQHNTLT